VIFAQPSYRADLQGSYSAAEGRVCQGGIQNEITEYLFDRRSIQDVPKIQIVSIRGFCHLLQSGLLTVLWVIHPHSSP
jgi:hypothetical protein